MNIKLADNVMVITGKFRGKSGKVLRLNKKQNKLVVEKVNIRTRHIPRKPNQPGQKIHYEAMMDASNVMVVCPSCSKPTRVAHMFLKTGEKQRVCKKCKQSLDKTTKK